MTSRGTHVLFSGEGGGRGISTSKESKQVKGTHQLESTEGKTSYGPERKGGELTRSTHELVSAHRRKIQHIGKKEAMMGDSHPIEYRGKSQ